MGMSEAVQAWHRFPNKWVLERKKTPTLGKNKAVPNFFTSVRGSDNMETH